MILYPCCIIFHCMIIPYFFHSTSENGHSGCFQFGVLTSEAAIAVPMCAFCWIHVALLLDVYLPMSTRSDRPLASPHTHTHTHTHTHSLTHRLLATLSNICLSHICPSGRGKVVLHCCATLHCSWADHFLSSLKVTYSYMLSTLP